MANKKRITNKPVQKSPASTKKAVTIMEQGPRDNTARVDGYGGHVKPLTTQFNNPLAKYSDELLSNFEKLSDILNLGKFNLKNLQGLDKIKAVVDKLNPEKLLKRFEDNVLGGRSIVSLAHEAKDLHNLYKTDKLGALTKALGLGGADGQRLARIVKNGQMAYKDAKQVYNVIKHGDWHSLQGIISSIGAVGNTNIGNALKGIIDLQAVSAFLAVNMQAAMNSGIPELVKEISGMFKDHKSKRAAASLGMLNAANRGDTEMINTILDAMGINKREPGLPTLGSSYEDNVIGNTAGSNSANGQGGSGTTDITKQSNYKPVKLLPIDVNSRIKNATSVLSPETVRILLENYRLDAFYRKDLVEQYRADLINTCNRIDPTWWYDEIDGNHIYTKLDPFRVLSNDSRMLLSLPVDDIYMFREECLISNSYYPKDIKQLTMTYYKDIAFANRPLDPRQKM